MEKEIDELREGYYYFQLLISNQNQAFYQVKYIFKYCFMGFYIAFLILITGLYFENNYYQVPIPHFILAIPLGIFLFGSYSLIVNPIFKKTMQKELNTNLDKELRKPRIIKFLFFFFTSILSMPAVMALFIYKII